MDAKPEAASNGDVTGSTPTSSPPTPTPPTGGAASTGSGSPIRTSFGEVPSLGPSVPELLENAQPHPLLDAPVPDYHLYDSDSTVAHLGTDAENGLATDDAAARRRLYGDNGLAQGKHRSVLSILLGQIFNPLVAILTVVFIIGIVTEEYIEAVVVVLVILLNGGIGAFQEIKSEASLNAIRHLAQAQAATVIRDGRPATLDLVDLVVGDVIELRLGQQVPADVRLFQTQQLEVDEAILTGEAVPVLKDHTLVLPPAADGTAIAVGDRLNMAFRQTTVVQGYGRAVVVAVGSRTEIGKITTRLTAKPKRQERRRAQPKVDESTGDAPSEEAKAASAEEKIRIIPLTDSMNQLLYGLLAVGIVFAIFILWAFDWVVDSSSLLYASATLVAILPEAAIVLITVTLALGARRMANQQAIVRQMGALEQLGRVTDICSDKTGTLTQGKMRPTRLLLYVGDAEGDGAASTSAPSLLALSIDGPALSRTGSFGLLGPKALASLDPSILATLTPDIAEGDNVNLADLPPTAAAAMQATLRVCALCSSTRLVRAEEDDSKLEGEGNPTEVALQELVHKACAVLPSLEEELWPAYTSRGEWGFTSAAKRMSAGWRQRKTGESVTVVKGAPERLLPLCTNLDATQRTRLEQSINALASHGLRVLAMAQRKDLDLSERNLHDYPREAVEADLTFVGMVALRDPPKPESFTALRECGRAGIAVRMLTGDHRATAEAIARELGVLTDEHEGAPYAIMTGPQLDAMTPEDLDALPDLPVVVARASPESKVRMVEALHRRGRVVAMTGDGVNDSPALRTANVGVAMGITGSDVTKGVADLVLADDNFATIVAAVREGRRIFDSVAHFLLHLLSGNMAEAVSLMLSLAFVVDNEGNPVFVLSPLAILYLNTATGSPPAIGLALDAPAPDIMSRPPIRHGLYTREQMSDGLYYGSLMGGFTLAAFCAVAWGEEDGDFGFHCNEETEGCGTVQRARGAAFLTLNTLLLLHAFNCRHPREPAWKLSLTENRLLAWSLPIGTLIAVPLLYVPWLSDKVFKHTGGSWEWGMVLGFCFCFQLFVEVYKTVKRAVLPPLSHGGIFPRDGDKEKEVAPEEYAESGKSVGTHGTVSTNGILSANGTQPLKGSRPTSPQVVVSVV